MDITPLSTFVIFLLSPLEYLMFCKGCSGRVGIGQHMVGRCKVASVGNHHHHHALQYTSNPLYYIAIFTTIICLDLISPPPISTQNFSALPSIVPFIADIAREQPLKCNAGLCFTGVCLEHQHGQRSRGRGWQDVSRGNIWFQEVARSANR